MADLDKHTGYIINCDFSVKEVTFIEESLPDPSLHIDPSDDEAWANAQPRLVTFFTDDVESVQGFLVTGLDEFTFHQDKVRVLERAAEQAAFAYEEIQVNFLKAKANQKRAHDAFMNAACQ